MIGGNELSRLILAALPLPEKKTGSSSLSRSLLERPAPTRAGDLSASDNRGKLDAARTALDRTLLDRALTLSLEAPSNDSGLVRDAAQTYHDAIADRISIAEPNARYSNDLATRSATEPALVLNPALTIVAAELTGTLLPKKISAQSALAAAQSVNENSRTSTDHRDLRNLSWPTTRILTSAAAIIACVCVVGWMVIFLGN